MIPAVLLLFELNSTLLIPETRIHFQKPGGSFEFKYYLTIRKPFNWLLLYKETSGESLLLINGSTYFENFANRVISELYGTNPGYVNLYHKLLDVRQSDTGLYKQACWEDGQLIYVYDRLEVCRHQLTSSTVFWWPGLYVDLQCSFNTSGFVTRWYHQLWQPAVPLISNGSSEALLDELKVRVQMFDSNSSIHFSQVTPVDTGDFYCQLLEGEQCFSFRKISLEPGLVRIFSSPGEAVILDFYPAYLNPEKLFWIVPNGKLIELTPESLRDEITHTEHRYMVHDSRSGNHSLVIQSLSANDTGLYTCHIKSTVSSSLLCRYHLFVCPELDPVTVTFSTGSSAVLVCDVNLTDYSRVQWFRRRSLWQYLLILDSEDSSQPELDLQGRVNHSIPSSALFISDLSVEDSGEYRCVVLKKHSGPENCFSWRKTFLLIDPQKDPFGIDSLFYSVYASLMGCGLVSMACVVLTVMLKSRRRDQASENIHENNPELCGLSEQSGGE